MTTQWQRRARAAGILALALTACTSSPYREVVVSFGDAGATTTPRAIATRSRDTLRFSVSAMQSPQSTHAAYSPLIERLGQRLGVDVELIQRRTYGEINDLLPSGGVDVAFICTGSYLDLERRAPGAVRLLAIPVIDGKTTYQSLIIVPGQSSASRMEDLKGKRFAFTDRLSFTGHAYPTHVLKALGTQPESFFGSTLLTHSHDHSIQAVAIGLVDGAAVDSLVYDRLVYDDPTMERTVRVIHRSPPFGMPPVVVSSTVPAKTRDRILGILLEIDRDLDAKGALRALRIDRFIVPPPDLYGTAAVVMTDRE